MCVFSVLDQHHTVDITFDSFCFTALMKQNNCVLEGFEDGIEKSHNYTLYSYPNLLPTV